MRQVLYVSSTSRDLAKEELSDILAKSRTNNASAGVTGMLLYLDGGFLQVLEGEAHILNELYSRIARDKRHWNAAILLDREAPRTFSNWTMGFKQISPKDGGSFELTRDAIAEHKVPPELMVMLKTFYSVQN